MTALAFDMRELTMDEIDMVSGGNWFSDLASAIAHYTGKLFETAVQVVENAAEWFFANFTVTYNSQNDSVIVQSK